MEEGEAEEMIAEDEAEDGVTAWSWVAEVTTVSVSTVVCAVVVVDDAELVVLGVMISPAAPDSLPAEEDTAELVVDVED